MYLLITRHFGETDIAGSATNLKSLKWTLSELQKHGDCLLAGDDSYYTLNQKLPTYKELLKIFKKRNSESCIKYNFTWLDSRDSPVEVSIFFVKENYAFTVI